MILQDFLGPYRESYKILIPGKQWPGNMKMLGCEFEALWVETINKKGPNILIAVI